MPRSTSPRVCLLAALALAAAPAAASAQGWPPAPPPRPAGCNAAQSAVAGALVGALAGRALGGRRGRGVLPGAALGAAVAALACTSANARTQQTRSNQQVIQDLGTGAPAAEGLKVVSYQSATSSADYAAGAEVEIRSDIVVAAGSNATAHQIVERYEITGPDGSRKEFSKPIVEGGGAFTNTLTMDLPTALPKGVYAVQTVLDVDGQPQGTSQLQFRIL